MSALGLSGIGDIGGEMSGIWSGAVRLLAAGLVVVMAGCGGGQSLPPATTVSYDPSPDYFIGPLDSLSIFVWRNPELSMSVPVRPDGKLTTPLVDDLQALGKTPTELERDLEKALVKYIRDPVVTVVGARDRRPRMGPPGTLRLVLGRVRGPERDARRLRDVADQGQLV